MMKLQFLGNLADKFRQHRIIGGVVIGLLAVLIVAGCVYGWKVYQFRQTSEYAFNQIKEALNPPDPARLAKLVDFNSLTDDLAGAVARNFPFFQAGADQKRNIKHIIQTALLKQFLDKDAGNKAPEETEEELLAKDLRIIPPDFASQLAASLNLAPGDKNNAMVTAKIENPQLAGPFTLVFNMRRAQDGFKVQHMVNANETASHLRKAMLARYEAKRRSYEQKNATTMKQMNNILPIQSCTADAGMLADGKTLVMVVHVLARNKSDVQVNNMTLDANVLGPGGRVLIRRYLNVARPVPQGTDFSHRWNFELDGASDVARNLLATRHLSCSAQWQTMGLGNGKVLHIQEVPRTNIKCNLEGHNHPAGFCILPVFKQ